MTNRQKAAELIESCYCYGESSRGWRDRLEFNLEIALNEAEVRGKEIERSLLLSLVAKVVDSRIPFRNLEERAELRKAIESVMVESLTPYRREN